MVFDLNWGNSDDINFIKKDINIKKGKYGIE